MTQECLIFSIRKRAKAEEAKKEQEIQNTGRGGLGPSVCPPYFVTHARQGIFVMS